MAMVPSYISRSVAGSFDNEGVAIFALVFVFYLYVKVQPSSCTTCLLLELASKGWMQCTLQVQWEIDCLWNALCGRTGKHEMCPK